MDAVSWPSVGCQVAVSRGQSGVSQAPQPTPHGSQPTPTRRMAGAISTLPPIPRVLSQFPCSFRSRTKALGWFQGENLKMSPTHPKLTPNQHLTDTQPTWEWSWMTVFGAWGAIPHTHVGIGSRGWLYAALPHVQTPNLHKFSFFQKRAKKSG